MTEPSLYQKHILLGLQDKHVYGGTVSFATLAKRRAKGKAQRAARRLNRGR